MCVITAVGCVTSHHSIRCLGDRRTQCRTMGARESYSTSTTADGGGWRDTLGTSAFAVVSGLSVTIRKCN